MIILNSYFKDKRLKLMSDGGDCFGWVMGGIEKFNSI
jgi:hypothetical protein